MEHNHSHTPKINYINHAFIVGIAINLFYVVFEFGAGFYYNSLSLISDATHNLSDVGALALALIAFRLSKLKANEKFTYGYRKSTILVSLLNSVVLFVVLGGIIRESIARLHTSVEIEGTPITIVAALGIIINAVSALLFFKEKDYDLNVKGAYLHLMADAAVSLGVVVSWIFISIFHLYWLDLVMSLLIVGVVFYSTWGLFRDSLSLTLDGVPRGIDFHEVMETIRRVEGVLDVHHLHVWALSTTQNALTAHVLVPQTTTLEQQQKIKQQIKHHLEHMQIQHVTIEFETIEEKCKDTNSIF